MALTRDNRGMTLVELAIVLAIASILFAIAAPTLTKNLPRIRLTGDARDVASVLRLARMKAVVESAQYGVLFDHGGTPPGYTLFEDTNESGDLDGSDNTQFTGELYKKTTYLRVDFANDVAVFRADGSSNGGSISLGLVERNDSLVVDVLPSTSRVKVIP